MTRPPRLSTLTAALLTLATTLPLTGCLVVGGYTSGGGWFLWPGSLGFLLVVLLLFFLLRGRR